MSRTSRAACQVGRQLGLAIAVSCLLAQALPLQTSPPPPHPTNTATPTLPSAAHSLPRPLPCLPNGAEAAQAWDDVRRSVLHDAVVSLLLPAMEREARAGLAADARAAVLDAAADRLWDYASQAPLLVGGGCWSPGGWGRPLRRPVHSTVAGTAAMCSCHSL